MPESAGLGALLRKCREAKRLSLDDLSRATCIVPRQLLALEEERLRDLPAAVFVRGFIRSCCAALGEPPERALALYEAWVAAAPSSPVRVPPTVLAEVGARRGSRWRSLAPKLLVTGLLVVIGGAVYLLVSSAGTRSVEPARRPDELPAPGGAAVVEQPLEATALGETAVASVPPAAPAPAEGAGGGSATRDGTGHVLVARVHEPTWVSVRLEDGGGSQELLGPGSVRAWRSPGPFTVSLGSAGSVTLELDGVPLPPLGNRGHVVRDLKIPREPAP